MTDLAWIVFGERRLVSEKPRAKLGAFAFAAQIPGEEAGRSANSSPGGAASDSPEPALSGAEGT
jgi:hypothetical protein